VTYSEIDITCSLTQEVALSIPTGQRAEVEVCSADAIASDLGAYARGERDR